MGNPLDVDTTALTVLGYPLSWLELAGTVFYLWSVWLIARQKILTWPIGIASSLLFLVLFYQVRLYSDALEQIYYLAASAYGWVLWTRRGARPGQPFVPRLSPARTLVAVVVTTLALSAALGTVMSRVHELLPALFTQPAAFPHLDALTTVMSFAAMVLMAQKRLESWVYWIVVDVIAIGLYTAQGVRFVALLYVALLVLAVRGLIGWLRTARGAGAVAARTAGRAG